MKIKIVLVFLTIFAFKNVDAQLGEIQNKEVDSSLQYKNGEGLFFNLGKGGANIINLFATVQSGLQYSNVDSGVGSSNSNRMSLNLARINLNFSGLKDKMHIGIVTDFTSTTPILEGWVGFNFWVNRHLWW